MLLRSDGHVVSCGDAADPIECSLIPSLPHGMMYTSIATGGHHAILLRSDGEAFAFGHNGDRRCDIPLCTPGTWYTSAAAGLRHSLLLRNDGRVIALGCNQLPPGHLNCFGGPCDVPNLPPGVVYCKSLDSDGDMMHRAPKVTAKSERALFSMPKNAETHQVSKSKFAITAENATSSPYAACLQYVFSLYFLWSSSRRVFTFVKMITPGFLVCAVDCHGNPWDHGMLIFFLWVSQVQWFWKWGFSVKWSRKLICWGKKRRDKTSWHADAEPWSIHFHLFHSQQRQRLGFFLALDEPWYFTALKKRQGRPPETAQR